MIYFIQAGDAGLVKIGHSISDPRARLSQLQLQSPERLVLLKVIEGDMEDERRFHRLFEADRVRGEWFNPTEGLMTTIAEAHSKTFEEVRLKTSDMGDECRWMLAMPRDLRRRIRALGIIHGRTGNQQAVFMLKEAIDREERKVQAKPNPASAA